MSVEARSEENILGLKQGVNLSYPMAAVIKESRPANDHIRTQETAENAGLCVRCTGPYQEPEPVKVESLQSNIGSTDKQGQNATPCETTHEYEEPEPVALRSPDGQSGGQMTSVAVSASDGAGATVDNRSRLRRMYGDRVGGNFCGRSVSRPWLRCGAVTAGAIIALVTFGIYMGISMKTNAEPKKEGNGDQPLTKSAERCYGNSGYDYMGPANITVSGKGCQRWDSQTPHKHTYTPEEYPDAGLEENYCRNPDFDDCPWCYTLDPDIRYDCCNICGLKYRK
ncbi:uncharacterized protein LOC144919961 [Branchiostoma floridae x Branchiostoma belcheri]